MEGRGRPPGGARRVLRWGGLRIAEHCDPARGIYADCATEMTARALLAARGSLRGASVCEVGCGTAVLSVLAARLGASEVAGTDCDGRCLRLAGATARESGARLDLRRGDLFAGLRGPFDVLVANLPQKPATRGSRLSPGEDGGSGGGAVLRRFLDGAGPRLGRGGRLFLFLHTLAPPSAFARLARGFRVEIPFWRRRLVLPGEYPGRLVRHWLGLASRGEALLEPVPGRPGWLRFYALQVCARLWRPLC